jgi:hypothetical protein
MTELQELEKLNAKITALLKKHYQQRRAHGAQLATLKRAGLVRAGEHWREGKYFYLIHHTDAHGNRKREYIGTDAKQIERARAAIRRAAEYDRLQAEERQRDKDLNEALIQLRAVFYCLK